MAASRSVALALGLQLKFLIITEGQDFHGSGIAMWTTRTVEIYSNSSADASATGSGSAAMGCRSH
ncbi:hypothetical protein KBZ15_15160 [Cyanobium sp. BA20m-p-22]|uniref:PIN domain-containing protein n=1 Tax=Cyanobium sp. BA20m-p-22 TaxID=2823704 RepID=UPI0037BFC240|nr:hypothetical protein [Cyanobium sp. BA20m-p-22]